MLDKSVPYARLYMKKPSGSLIPQFPLPPGYKYVMYKDGFEEHWARIETAVLEFDSEFAALMRFKQDFVPFADELYRRCLFIEADDGTVVATANAWWSYVTEEKRSFLRQIFNKHSERLGKNELDDRRAWIHWVSVDPEYQGLGLGKAVVSRVLEIMRDVEGDVDIYLRTQTWSYKAIGIYKKCGFEPTDEEKLYGKRNKGDFKRALDILEGLRNAE